MRWNYFKPPYASDRDRDRDKSAAVTKPPSGRTREVTLPPSGGSSRDGLKDIRSDRDRDGVPPGRDRDGDRGDRDRDRDRDVSGSGRDGVGRDMREGGREDATLVSDRRPSSTTSSFGPPGRPR